MKRLILFILLCGCGSHKQFTNIPQQNQKTQIQKSPCAPNMAQEFSGVVHPQITEKNLTNSSWVETHNVSCPRNMRTVLPSSREFVDAMNDAHNDINQWYAEHEYCIPDGGKP